MHAPVPPSTPADDAGGASASASRVDARASARARQRLDAAPEPPWLHAEAARRMAERLTWIKREPALVLDWSGRAGASAPSLAQAYPAARVLAVCPAGPGAEAAPPAPWWRRLWRPGEAEVAAVAVDATAGLGAGLLWSNMRLHFAPDPEPLMQAWHRATAPDGFLMFSTLGPGSLSLLREVYDEAGWGTPHAPFVDMHDLGDMLVAHGWAEPVMDQETLRLTYRSPEALVTELHGLGANFSPRRFAGLRTPRWRSRLCHALGQRAVDGLITLDIELVYGHAFRAADAGPRVQAETQIALDEMKLMLRNAGPKKQAG
ncbi:biotin synthase [Ideonella sp.]|uniref:biotin synthase n=1 Tax=Ideonella sp. TaxID=1929293 RepID=UPI0035B3204B